MKFKKIYIEITNICNLSCSFCPKIDRKPEFMTLEKFRIILEKIKGYTNYIYLHVKGEPLLHREVIEIIKTAELYNIKVNITTNGTILNKEILELEALRQINFSLHSFEGEDSTEKQKYLENILNYAVLAKKKGEISSLRLWNLKNRELNKESLETIKFIETFFNMKIDFKNLDIKRGIKLEDSIYLNFEEVFQWPNLKNKEYEVEGYCYALNSHIAILVDGTVIPCCLDDNGVINLGNIFEQNLADILKSERASKIIEGFKNRICVEELCKNCSFKNRF